MRQNSTKFIIYLVSSPSNKVYVGYTGKSLEERRAGHEKDARHSDLPFHKAIRKYGSLLTWNVLIDDIKSIKMAHKLEKATILKYKSYERSSGYNCTLGGDGCLATKETKRKISKSVKATGANPGKLRQRPIVVFRKDGSFIGNFDNQVDCGKALGFKPFWASRCLRGVYKSYRGYTFKYRGVK